MTVVEARRGMPEGAVALSKATGPWQTAAMILCMVARDWMMAREVGLVERSYMAVESSLY